MFAFAIADRVNRTLYLACDRLGEPLYVWTAPSGDTVFASELKSIASRADFACEIHPVALGGYLLLNYVPGEATLLRDAVVVQKRVARIAELRPQPPPAPA